MKIEYKGINPEENRNYREAWITYDEEREEEKAIKVLGLLECMGWEIYTEEGWSIIRVSDKEEYEMVRADYKKAKTMI